jgi:hypothetical protein
VILIVSSNYLRSKVCREEMYVALGRAMAGEARIVPIKIDDCAITQRPLRDMQWVVPEDARWTNVRTKIMDAVMDVAVGTSISQVFRPWTELSEEIAQRIATARQLWLGCTSGQGWFRDYKAEFTRMRGSKWLLFMNPRSEQFATVLAAKWRAGPAWTAHSTWDDYKEGAMKLMLGLKKHPKVRLRVTDTALSASVLFIDPPFKINKQTGSLIPSLAPNPPVLFLELPAYPSYRTRPMAKVFSFGEDLSFFRLYCEAFASHFAGGEEL